MSTTDNVYLLLFLCNLFLFFVGMFLDAGPAILILGPVLGPLFVGMGVDPSDAVETDLHKGVQIWPGEPRLRIIAQLRAIIWRCRRRTAHRG